MAGYILVPLDGSALAESALPLDIILARLTSSGITLLRAVPAPVSVVPPIGASTPADSLGGTCVEERVAARDYLDKVGQHIEDGGLNVRTEIVDDSPAAAIAKYAKQDADVWLIAMATRHTPSGSWPFGSVAEEVLHLAHKPVLLTRPSDQRHRAQEVGCVGIEEEIGGQPLSQLALNTIIVPLDGSRFAEVALEHARRLALLQGATVVLVCAIPPPDNQGMEEVEFIRLSADVARDHDTMRLTRYLADTAEQLRAQGLKVITELVYGRPEEAILRSAERLHGDLIVVAAHGRREFERLWLGSVAQKLVQSSRLPVLLIRRRE